MFKIWKKHSINQINIIAILFAGIFAAVAAFVVIFNEYREFEKDIIATEVNYLKNQKRRAVEQTSRLYRLIDYRFNELKDEKVEVRNERIANEIGIVLDDSSAGGYIFVYDKNREAVYRSNSFIDDSFVIDKLFDVSYKGGTVLTFETEKNSEKIENLAYIRE